MTTVTINAIPLLTEEEVLNSDEYMRLASSECMSHEYFIKPVYEYLPNLLGLEDEQRLKYLFKNVPENMYLTGLEIISDSWVSPGFSDLLYNSFGLVLGEAKVMNRQEDHRNWKESFMYLNYKHAALESDQKRTQVILGLVKPV